MSQLALEDDVFTGELTNDQLVITSTMGVRKITIYNPTAVGGTVTGTKYLGALAPSALTIGEEETLTLTVTESAIFKNLTINAPVGCTLRIVAIG